MNRTRRVSLAAWVALTAMTSGVLQGQDGVLLPAEAQVALFQKIWSFDRSRAAPPGTIIVVYQSRFRHSLVTKDELLEAIARNGRKMTAVPVDLDRGSGELDAVLEHAKNAVLYVAPLRAVEVRTVTAPAARYNVRTITAVREYVGRGVAVGVFLRGKRAAVVIDLKQSRREGADFSSQLLKLAEVIP